MAFVNALQDGVTVPHYELMTALRYDTERACKEFIERYDIHYEPVNGVWWVAMEDVRTALRSRAKTHKQRREEKADKRAGSTGELGEE